MPTPKDIDKAYAAFRQHHPQLCVKESEAPKDGDAAREEPEGLAPHTILPLPPNAHKQATCPVQRDHIPWAIPKDKAPEADVPPVRHHK